MDRPAVDFSNFIAGRGIEVISRNHPGAGDGPQQYDQREGVSQLAFHHISVIVLGD